jgi:MoaA/NifB/PqqE/SkfB family radical SAM enzyme
MLKIRTVVSLSSNLIRNGFAVKFAHIQLTTKCNAKCLDRCDIWASKPKEIPFQDLKFTIDLLAKNNFSVIYFTGGEPSLYPDLVEALEYVKSKNMLTSLTSNGSITLKQLWELKEYVDLLSISVDHYDEKEWNRLKNVDDAAAKAKTAIEAAKKFGINVVGLTFINPSWTTKDIEKIVKYTNDELGTSFSFCYPFISSIKGTFAVGKNLSLEKQQIHLKQLFGKIKNLKEQGYDVINLSEYLEDIQLAHSDLPMKHSCKAGRNVLFIDCNLDVFPCFKRAKMFNLKKDPFRLNAQICPFDDKNCLTGCFKEPSVVSGKRILNVIRSESPKNLKIYLKYVRGVGS